MKYHLGIVRSVFCNTWSYINRQGNDVGTQYKKEIFYQNDAQQRIAGRLYCTNDKEDTFGKPIVTKISAASKFYVAEDYHKNYYNDNKSQGLLFLYNPLR
jgi:peptide-methionine (S)-S-oxide reductase